MKFLAQQLPDKTEFQIMVRLSNIKQAMRKGTVPLDE